MILRSLFLISLFHYTLVILDFPSQIIFKRTKSILEMHLCHRRWILWLLISAFNLFMSLIYFFHNLTVHISCCDGAARNFFWHVMIFSIQFFRRFLGCESWRLSWFVKRCLFCWWTGSFMICIIRLGILVRAFRRLLNRWFLAIIDTSHCLCKFSNLRLYAWLERIVINTLLILWRILIFWLRLFVLNCFIWKENLTLAYRHATWIIVIPTFKSFVTILFPSLVHTSYIVIG